MTKRFWMFVTFAGVVVAIAGLIATIALAAETGERVPDSECSSMAPASVFSVCFTSDDPKVFLGVGPMLLGFAMIGGGIWRWIATADTGDGSSGGGLFASIRSLQQQAADQMAASAGTMSAGSAPPATPPTPPSSPPPGEEP